MLKIKEQGNQVDAKRRKYNATFNANKEITEKVSSKLMNMKNMVDEKEFRPKQNSELLKYKDKIDRIKLNNGEKAISIAK